MRSWLWPLLAGVLVVVVAGAVHVAAAPAPGLGVAAAPSPEGRVQLSVQAGFGRKAKMDGWAPVQVEIVNQGAAVDGQLVARQPRAGGGPVAVYSLPLPAQSGARTVEIAYEVAGQPFAAVTAAVDLVGPEDLLAGVLSQEPVALDAFGQVKLAGRAGSVRLVRLLPEAFPDNLTQLDNFDLLALARFPSTRLSPAQGRALAAWVRRGGLLVLVGGPEWQGTIAGLPPELVPVQPTGTRPIQDLPVLAALGGKELPARGRPIALTTATLRDARVLIEDGADPVIAVGRLGQGTILNFGVDLTLDPFASWSGRREGALGARLDRLARAAATAVELDLVDDAAR